MILSEKLSIYIFIVHICFLFLIISDAFDDLTVYLGESATLPFQSLQLLPGIGI